MPRVAQQASERDGSKILVLVFLMQCCNLLVMKIMFSGPSRDGIRYTCWGLDTFPDFLNFIEFDDGKRDYYLLHWTEFAASEFDAQWKVLQWLLMGLKFSIYIVGQIFCWVLTSLPLAMTLQQLWLHPLWHGVVLKSFGLCDWIGTEQVCYC